MCNIRCTSREKREDASPQKPQSSAKVHGDTNTHWDTHERTTHAQREQTPLLSSTLTLYRSQEKANSLIARCERNRQQRGELCDMVIWCRLAELLQFADKNHNEATPANPYTLAPLFNQKAAFLRPFEKKKQKKKNSVAPKKNTGLSPREAGLYKLYWLFRSLVLAAFASGGVPALQQLCAGSFPWLSSCHHISLHLEGLLCSLQAVLHSRVPFDFF